MKQTLPTGYSLVIRHSSFVSALNSRSSIRNQEHLTQQGKEAETSEALHVAGLGEAVALLWPAHGASGKKFAQVRVVVTPDPGRLLACAGGGGTTIFRTQAEPQQRWSACGRRRGTCRVRRRVRSNHYDLAEPMQVRRLRFHHGANRCGERRM